MLELIYIVENDNPINEAEYKPDFVFYNEGDKGEKKERVSNNEKTQFDYTFAANVIGGVALRSIIPFPYFIASAIAPSIISLITEKNGDKVGIDEKDNSNAKVEQKKEELLLSYLNKISFSPNQAKRSGYKFQPGHPLIGKTYKRHPLAEYEQVSKHSLYIPNDYYDQILLEERETEMIKILVDLGAKKIIITSIEEKNDESTKKYSAKGGVDTIGNGSVEYSDSTASINSSLNTREYVLSGKKWSSDSRLERQNFFWLDYEPAWNAVVHARECGGCIQASFELKETTSFSVDKNLEIEIKAKMIHAGGGFGANDINKKSKKYYVYVEFNPVE
ncbi:hypothetical protein [Pectobacterium odoriferum]|uniref:hypothetical protein n=1 Tax=Pectobacterium odoriferum TaxID=78398 RepID=UPI000CD1A1A7|nr:hypothetical protein [Pectobacterium odoriferum]POD96416.1 hypothetical protein BVY06_08730 [Pectobacterium odoriferum]